MGLVFETAFAYSFEISLKPTNIERMTNPNYDENYDDNPEDYEIPGCGIVLTKCLGEMIGIFLFIIVGFGVIIVGNDTYTSGKPNTCILELIICFFID